MELNIPAIGALAPPARNRAGGATAPDHLVLDPAHPRRGQVEAFIARRFLDVHGARITQFMPRLIALFGAGGEVLAAVGMRDASCEPLFLEYYLDLPVERAIAGSAADFTLPPERSRVVEIGNLASIDRRASRKLFGILAARLDADGYQWAVFTGCSSLHRMFRTLGIETRCLGRALQSRLPPRQQTWGGYYEDNPMVVAGKVSRGRALLAQAPGSAALS